MLATANNQSGGYMKKTKISEALKELSEGEDRSIKARMEDVYEDIEATLKAGVKREKVIEMLKENGLDVSATTFNTTLTRIRKERRGSDSTEDKESSPREEEKTIKESSPRQEEKTSQVPTAQDYEAMAVRNKLTRRSK